MKLFLIINFAFLIGAGAPAQMTGVTEMVPINFSHPVAVKPASVAAGQLQAIMFDGAVYYVGLNNTIEKFDGNWNLLALSNNVFLPLTWPAQQVMEDGDFYNGHLVIPQMTYTNINYGGTFNLQLAILDTNLNVLSTHGISNYMVQCSSLVDDPDNHILYACDEYDGSRLYRFDDTNFNFLGTLLLVPGISKRQALQGICLHDHLLYLEANYGEGAIMYGINPLTGTNSILWTMTDSNIIPGGVLEPEGLDWNGTNLLFAIAGNLSPYICFFAPENPLSVSASNGRVTSSWAVSSINQTKGMTLSQSGFDGLNEGLQLDIPFSSPANQSVGVGYAAYDYSQNGYQLLAYSFGQVWLTNGISGSGEFFNAHAGGALYLPDTTAFSQPANLTIALWINTTMSHAVALVSKQTPASPAPAFNLFYDRSTNLTWRVYCYTNQPVNITASIPSVADGKWHHIVATYAGTTNASAGNNMFLYLDGRMVASGKNNDSSTMQRDTYDSFSLGNNGVYQYVGIMDDVKVWNRALLANEVLYLYNENARNKVYNGTVTATGLTLTSHAPPPVVTSGTFWNSNNYLYWVTPVHTNLISAP